MSEYDHIADRLIDVGVVNDRRIAFMREAVHDYEKAVSLMGYFSGLTNYQSEYETLSRRTLHHRRSLLALYMTEMTKHQPSRLKQVLCPPDCTQWFRTGVSKYKKIRSYSVFYYRRQLCSSMDRKYLNLDEIRSIITVIISLDKYYHIYEDAINYMMNEQPRFAKVMSDNFPDLIFL